MVTPPGKDATVDNRRETENHDQSAGERRQHGKIVG